MDDEGYASNERCANYERDRDDKKFANVEWLYKHENDLINVTLLIQ